MGKQAEYVLVSSRPAQRRRIISQVKHQPTNVVVHGRGLGGSSLGEPESTAAVCVLETGCFCARGRIRKPWAQSSIDARVTFRNRYAKEARIEVTFDPCELQQDWPPAHDAG